MSDVQPTNSTAFKPDPELIQILKDAKIEAESRMTPIALYKFRLRMAREKVILQAVFEGRSKILGSDMHEAEAQAVAKLIDEERERCAGIIMAHMIPDNRGDDAMKKSTEIIAAWFKEVKPASPDDAASSLPDAASSSSGPVDPQ